MKTGVKAPCEAMSLKYTLVEEQYVMHLQSGRSEYEELSNSFLSSVGEN
jgi:hypothetical protein